MSTFRKRAEAHKKASYEAAQKLDQIGMDVCVFRDDGSALTTKLTALPWSIADGYWVAKVEGITGSYDCSRIRPTGPKRGKA